jgi:hypothetical protein
LGCFFFVFFFFFFFEIKVGVKRLPSWWQSATIRLHNQRSFDSVLRQSARLAQSTAIQQSCTRHLSTTSRDKLPQAVTSRDKLPQAATSRDKPRQAVTSRDKP